MKQLLKIIKRDKEVKPAFIENNSQHQIIHGHIQFIFTLIEKLATPQFLPDTKLMNIALHINETIMSLIEWSSETYYLILISPYLNERLQRYKEISLDKELYEALQNIIEIEKLIMI